MQADTDLIVRVARADVLTEMAFSRSLGHWQDPDERGIRWKAISEMPSDILIGSDDGIIIEGACNHCVSAPDGGTIVVSGDLEAQLDLGGISEVIISGHVAPNARITSTGICHVFVNGDVRGNVSSKDSLKLWVEGSFSGELLTGSPSTHLWVSGDMDGHVRPRSKASLLWIFVDGYVHEDVLSRIADHGYTTFNASVGKSNVPKGVYPSPNKYRQLAQQRSFNRWSVSRES
ncbi:MAG TPA: hypothetical protein VGN12_08675 [Pirellulales bacterium]|jgi:hypothetical protein